METTKGSVSAISQKEKGYSIKVNDKWLSGFGKCPYTKDQEVELNYESKEVNGKVFNNIKKKTTEFVVNSTPYENTAKPMSFIDISIGIGQAGNQAVQIIITQPIEVQKLMHGDMETYVKLTEYFFKANTIMKQNSIKENETHSK